MVFSVAAATARRRFAMMAKQTTQRRTMAGGAAPEWEGVDKVVRGYFPKDSQLCMAILGGYFSLFALFKIKSAISKKAPKEEIVAAPSSSSSDASGMPSLDSPEFGEWIGSESFNKMLESA
ncbi:hypothetical protein FRACYDRAFT_259230 [Fragilariopsis cylindrus CCMP1102]|uniref:Uncharacterized protein n=1 Tax=Fragilariopsis cylindrus CCMP1102 TaxID=635003 RepID=A0A1E7FXI5_9STRA|nr:hypothetical protein FRACYDRAFT_259230 [Fragilariopsis cylindrus CCMP1102]|eukprot:OEU22859.1 hypothetical protein FRACYDRAFT_259230 [Fragilariopsis cylindrus CCMP1102]